MKQIYETDWDTWLQEIQNHNENEMRIKMLGKEKNEDNPKTNLNKKQLKLPPFLGNQTKLA